MPVKHVGSCTHRKDNSQAMDGVLYDLCDPTAGGRSSRHTGNSRIGEHNEAFDHFAWFAW
jgi:hypothetical protein